MEKLSILFMLLSFVLYGQSPGGVSGADVWLKWVSGPTLSSLYPNQLGLLL
ncbi:hypothetical protein GNY06_03970 [Elizabethkingia argentiflava]|uniref:Uncharacterized protein n=1 Tax=Elizabethkingia argenteiflava TaxID=2681556 RepID=A0A845PSE0_9FLAO|nr:hypothetical protein [Elizabethkingia argenteiflava]NAW50575.1 hypothetical protein [Elizabethkingia argenteiflava]